MADLLDSIETYGSTCWEPLCDWDSPERFTRGEAMEDAAAHRKFHDQKDRNDG
jgi:hypothetical protein